MITAYDPEIQPDPHAWLAMDEHQRTHLVEEFHRNAKIKLPNLKVHAVFHSVVENQLAEMLDPVVRAVARLRQEGLSRHDSIHAVSTILAEHMYDLFNDEAEAENSQTLYYSAIEELTVQSWREG